MAKYSRDFFMAMCSFLNSEKVRHEEDITMIELKLQELKAAGYECNETTPWVEGKDIEPQDARTVEWQRIRECPGVVYNPAWIGHRGHNLVDERIVIVVGPHLQQLRDVRTGINPNNRVQGHIGRIGAAEGVDGDLAAF